LPVVPDENVLTASIQGLNELDLTYHLHSLFACFLFFQEFHPPGDITTILKNVKMNFSQLEA
jgi:hypothetical protein